MSNVARIRRARAKVKSPVSTALSAWDGKVTPEAWARLQEVMTADFLTEDRGDGSGRLRPSSIHGPCQRLKILSFRGERSADPAPENLAMMDAGTYSHYRWQVNGLSAGIFTDIEVPVTYDPWLLAGAMDAVITDGTPFELKTMNSWRYDRAIMPGNETPYTGHLWQVNGYMKATGTEECSLVYEDRNTLRFHEFRVTFDPYIYAELEEAMLNLVEHANGGTIPDILEGCRTKSTSTYRRCDWKKPCFAQPLDRA